MKHHYFILISISLFFACDSNNNEKKEKQPTKTLPVSVCYSPKVNDKDWFASGNKAPKFKGLEGIDFKISTCSKSWSSLNVDVKS